MDTDLLNKLPYEVRPDLRVALLSSLLWGTPREWRMRRTDRYRDCDGLVFEHQATVDFRIERRLVVDSLAGLRAVYELAPSLLEKSNAVAVRERIGRLIAASEAVSADAMYWSMLDLIIPVGWLFGPAMQLEVVVDDEHVPVLNRMDTAEVVARSLSYLLVRAADEYGGLGGLVEDPAVLRRLLWLLVASDIHSIVEQLRPQGLAHPKLDQRVQCLADWMEEILSSYQLMLADREGLVSSLRRACVEVDELRRRHHHHRDMSALSTPLFNPLLLFQAYMSRGVREHHGLSDPVSSVLLGDFFAEVREYLALADRIVSSADGSDGQRAYVGEVLVSAIQRLSWMWPLLVRVSVDVDESHSMGYKSTEFSIDEGRGVWRRYDLFIGDAATYHVELAASHGELELVPGSARVMIADDAGVSRRAEPDVFDRESSESKTVQSFYTSAPWIQPASEAVTAGARVAYLQVKQRVSRAVMWTNWLVVGGLFLGTAYLWYLALLDVMLVPHGRFTVIGVFKVLISVYLAVLLLFTLERHGSVVVAKRLRWPWLITLMSLTLGSIAIILHAWHLDRQAIPLSDTMSKWGRLLFDFVRR